MRIAVVVSTFPLISETFILNQITGLIDLGHNVDILSLHKPLNNSPDHEAIKGYHLLKKTKYLEIPRKRLQRVLKAAKVILINFLTSPLAILKCLSNNKYGRYQSINNLFKLEPFIQKKYDIIHFHFGPIAQEFIFLKDFLPKSKMVVTFHGYDIQVGLRKDPSFYQNIFQLLDKVISPTQYCHQALIKMNCPQEKIIDLSDGVYTEIFNPTIKVSDHNKIRITTIARLDLNKNISLALKIIHKIVNSSNTQITYKIIGDGPERNNLEEEIAQLNLNQNVSLLGALSQKEIIHQLNNTNIFLLTSIQEGFGIVLLEAQAMEIPIVASKTGGVPEAIISNQTGFLFDINNPEEAVNHLLLLTKDQNKREVMGKAGREFVERVYSQKMLNLKLEKIYQEIAEN